MMLFWLAGAAMIAAALAFVVPPLIRPADTRSPSRDQANVSIYHDRMRELDLLEEAGTLDTDQATQAREELDRELLTQTGESSTPSPPLSPPLSPTARPVLAIILAVLLPVFAIGIYLQVGTPHLLLEGEQAAAAERASPNVEQPSVDTMVGQLEERLRAQPDDARGWLMLGRSYAVMNRHEQARDALVNAIRLAPDDPETMVTYADTLTRLNGGTLDGEAINLVNRALAAEGNNPRALWLAGIHALNQGIPSQARGYWQKLLDVGQLDPASHAQVSEAMASVRSAVEREQTADNKPPTDADTPVAGAAELRINVALSPELQSSISGKETVFVFARANTGPPMPLAVERLTANQLPITVVLNDSKSMAPELMLSRFETVVVTARISRAGTPRAAPGDMQGISTELDTRSGETVDLMIDQVVE
ncbi:MAG: cytochrome c-type biogenesis protein CcmH [Gammaproteobacteria bacterium]|jgi:cytochrome c-type biogenesis protein CcmH